MAQREPFACAVTTDGEGPGSEEARLTTQLIPVNQGSQAAREHARWFCEHTTGRAGRAVVVADVVAASGTSEQLFELRQYVRSRDGRAPMPQPAIYAPITERRSCGRVGQQDRTVSKTFEIPDALPPRELFVFYCWLNRSAIGAATANGRTLKIRDLPENIESFELGLRSFAQLRVRPPLP